MKNSFLFLFVFLLFSCDSTEKLVQTEAQKQESEQAYVEALEVHLKAVRSKDLTTLEATLSPKGDMQFLLPQSERMTTVKEFMDHHRGWFAIPNWTFETKMIHSDIGQDMGISVVEIVYREPDRNGKPYFNRMYVSYALKKIDGKWYVIKDHASSIEKSTDTD